MANLTPLGRTTIIVSWVATTLAFISLALSLASHIHVRRSLAITEYLTYAAFLIGVILIAQNTFAILVEGQAEHQTQLRDSQINTLAKSILLHEALWSLVNALIRISACLLILKIFGVVRKLRYCMVPAICLSTLHALACVLDLLLICRPISAQWRAEVNAVCGNQKLSFIILESTAIALDFIIVVAPIYPLSKVKHGKISLWKFYLTFEIGAVLFIIAGLRLKALSYATSLDFIYSKSYLGLLSALGVMMGITICVVPKIPGILKMLRYVSREYMGSLNLVSEKLKIRVEQSLVVIYETEAEGKSQQLSSCERKSSDPR
ncbi:hypothetical protein DM02DRAFT_251259 [Periconia macrospinosa]|uniref:Rhodopsin domain-containing protein n=1 Tax=Periconia macrospinosa TaxID=97972 RepID=A0A2V1DYJ6_9PLEO|nr:hypothetical protein DM02DRAFT_251259 [Periconia macrospinosa]